MKLSWLQRMDAWRHRIPFWWWLTYDALVLIVILLGFFGYRNATLWLGVVVLSIAVVIDVIEFIVKRPVARVQLRKSILYCNYCGYLGWTIRQHGRVTHKHNCPFRIDTYCQSHPVVCDEMGG